MLGALQSNMDTEIWIQAPTGIGRFQDWVQFLRVTQLTRLYDMERASRLRAHSPVATSLLDISLRIVCALGDRLHQTAPAMFCVTTLVGTLARLIASGHPLSPRVEATLALLIRDYPFMTLSEAVYPQVDPLSSRLIKTCPALRSDNRPMLGANELISTLALKALTDNSADMQTSAVRLSVGLALVEAMLPVREGRCLVAVVNALPGVVSGLNHILARTDLPPALFDRFRKLCMAMASLGIDFQHPGQINTQRERGQRERGPEQQLPTSQYSSAPVEQHVPEGAPSFRPHPSAEAHAHTHTQGGQHGQMQGQVGLQ
ncbi:hypothetical protein KIPB_003927 [Kipferlia bialata]|uniref:Uncharacterized protein n=1 Tax=Kipferlia bialata TaxID=797122 RepID=A0A9K3GHS4_9EUKA|nr:hypothetical protein KIPB_003927 [Kipferlia bialata]|eukprot:g3927.t1